MKLTALVVDDDFHSREKLRVMLEEKGLEVVVADEDVEGFIEFCKHAPSILFFADPKVPTIVSFDLVEWARSAPWKTVTVLMMGYTSREAFHDLLEVETDYCITKPFNLVVVEPTIDEILQSFWVPLAAFA